MYCELKSMLDLDILGLHSFMKCELNYNHSQMYTASKVLTD